MTTEAGATRSRRALLVAGLGALGATVASAVGHPEPTEAASAVQLGASNTETRTTTIQNSSRSTTAVAITGRLSHASSSHGSAGVKGEDDGSDGIGVYGLADHGSSARGVSGHSTNGIGVYGRGTNYIGVYGSGGSYGFYAPAGGAYGFYGSGSTSGGDFFGGPWGVYGVGTSYGVEGIATPSSGTGYGLYGYVSSSVGPGYGVYGSGNSAGVYGNSTNVGTWGGASSSSPTYGLVGFGASYGVWGQAPGTGYAVYASGNAWVTGTPHKAAGSFKIDHPLDPERKWLSHSFVESPDMMNVYNGNAVLDAKGQANVTLPRYFGALNRDFRYQLTAIGGAAPSLHISQKVTRNRFRIAGGSPAMEVSWQVTGIRQDDYAKARPIVVETRKTTQERGTRQFVPAGSTATLMNVGPRHVTEKPAMKPHSQGLHPRQL